MALGVDVHRAELVDGERPAAQVLGAAVVLGIEAGQAAVEPDPLLEVEDRPARGELDQDRQQHEHRQQRQQRQRGQHEVECPRGREAPRGFVGLDRLGSALAGVGPGIVLCRIVRGAVGARTQRFVQTHRGNRP